MERSVRFMPKFIKIDLLENLEKIMKQITKSY